MSALVAGFLLVGYLLGPGAIYRLIFSLFIPAKRFQRTRTEEVVFSALVTVLPFLLAWALTRTPLGAYPHCHIGVSKSRAYSVCIDSLIGSSATAQPSIFFRRAFYEQARLICYVWLLCAAEALLIGRLVANYGDLKPSGLLRWVCNRFLLKHVSEWHVLFSGMALPSSDPRKQVVVDALTGQNIVYRGSLVDWFLDQDGKLAGIFLEKAERFNRDELKRDREAGRSHAADTYWRQIPGAKLYLTAGSIANYNVRYQVPTSAAATAAITQELSFGDDIEVTALIED